MAGKHFWEKTPVDSADTLWVKNFAEIDPSCTVSEINAFLRFTQKFKMADKMAGKRFLEKLANILHRYPLAQKFH